MKSRTLPSGSEHVSVLYNPKKGNKKLLKLFNEIVACMAFVLDLDESRKLLHAWRVTVLAAKLAQQIRVDSYDLTFYAGLLHDIGAIGLKDHLIHYPTLTKQLSNPLVRDHPYKGAEMVRLIPGLFPSADLIFEHHERYDGKGYPLGIKREEILPEAQFLRVADSFDFWLRSHRLPRAKADRVDAAPSFVEFYKSFAKNANLEFSDDVLFSFLDLLRGDDLYRAVIREENLPFLLQETVGGLSGIELRHNVDLVGTTLNLFAELIDSKHSYTQGHSKRVSEYCVLLAQGLELPHDEVTRIKWAALLHDVGKVAIPRKILDKPGPLTPKEWKIVKKHPLLTMEILNMISPFKNLVKIAGCHQERYGGKGYPAGLKGKEIPYGARILAVADALDAMTSNRPYRPTWTFKEALKEILREAGKQFDPKIAKTANLIFG